MANTPSKGPNKGGKLLQWQRNMRSVRRLSYGDLDPIALQRAIRVVTDAGGALMLGLTSDGGAYSVLVLHGDDKVKEYPNSVESLEALLESLSEGFDELLA